MHLQPVYRITLFVPHDAREDVIAAIKRVYPLGDDYYDSVLWYLEDAREQFRPRALARPARGRTGELHEERVSMLVFALPREKDLLNKVLEQGIKPHHPWEMPGIFIEESWILAAPGHQAGDVS